MAKLLTLCGYQVPCYKQVAKIQAFLAANADLNPEIQVVRTTADKAGRTSKQPVIALVLNGQCLEVALISHKDWTAEETAAYHASIGVK